MQAGSESPGFNLARIGGVSAVGNVVNCNRDIIGFGDWDGIIHVFGCQPVRVGTPGITIVSSGVCLPSTNQFDADSRQRGTPCRLRGMRGRVVLYHGINRSIIHCRNIYTFLKNRYIHFKSNLRQELYKGGSSFVTRGGRCLLTSRQSVYTL